MKYFPFNQLEDKLQYVDDWINLILIVSITYVLVKKFLEWDN